MVGEGLSTAASTHLHHELPATWKASLCKEHVLRLLFLFGLLNLCQSANRIHPLAIIWGCL